MKRAVAVAAVTGLCLIGAGSAWAVFPGQNGRIAYSDYSNGSLHTVLPSGHGDTVIGQGSDPAWSPNGRRIAFLQGGNIFTMRADGSDLRQLTFFKHRFAGPPSYAPNGRRIVFSWFGTIVVMRSDGSKRRAIGGGSARTWSPNGRIVYDTGIGSSRDRDSLWTMRPDGTHKRRLVFLGSGFDYAGSEGPFYSPNGRKFIFTRCEYTPGGGIGSSCDGFVARANGNHVRPAPCDLSYEVTDNSIRGLIPLTYAPDGNEFLVARPNVIPLGETANIVRLALPSCAGQRVVGRVAAGGSADWQALSVP